MESKDLTFVLFPNENRKSDRHPTHSGKATINGVEYFADAWENEKNGRKYFSGKLKPKDTHSHSRNSGYTGARPDNTPANADEEPAF